MGIIEMLATIPLFAAVISGVVVVSRQDELRFKKAADALAATTAETTFSLEERRVAKWESSSPNQTQTQRIDIPPPPFVPLENMAWNTRHQLGATAFRVLLGTPDARSSYTYTKRFVSEEFLDENRNGIRRSADSAALRSLAAQYALCVAEHCLRYPNQACPLTGLTGIALQQALRKDSASGEGPCPRTEAAINMGRQQVLRLLALHGARAELQEQTTTQELTLYTSRSLR